MRLVDASETRNRKGWRAPLILIAGAIAGLAFGWRFLAQDPAAGTDGISTPPLPVSGQVFILPTATGEPAILPALAPGNPAPDFTLKSLDGGQITLSEYRGRPVLINFWASWCPPCRIEMPELVRTYEEHKGTGFTILGINLTFQDALPEIVAFVEEFKMTFPILLDETGEVTTQKYRLLGLPMSVFVDRDGAIRRIQIGVMTADQIREFTAEILD